MDKDIQVSVNLPVDDSGMLDRRCPNCEREFRIHKQSFEVNYYLNLRCPYCRLVNEFEDFTTELQREYAKAVVMGGEGRKLVEDTLDEALGDLADIGDITSISRSIPSPHLNLDTKNHTCSECGFVFETLSEEESGCCPVCRC